jgi:hypothetical protein
MKHWMIHWCTIRRDHGRRSLLVILLEPKPQEQCIHRRDRRGESVRVVPKVLLPVDISHAGFAAVRSAIEVPCRCARYIMQNDSQLAFNCQRHWHAAGRPARHAGGAPSVSPESFRVMLCADVSSLLIRATAKLPSEQGLIHTCRHWLNSVHMQYCMTAHCHDNPRIGVRRSRC